MPSRRTFLAKPRFFVRLARRMRLVSASFVLIFGIVSLSLFFNLFPTPKSKPAVRVPAETRPSQVTSAYGKLPIRFEINEGQVGTEVKFIARGGGYKLYFTAEGPIIALQRRKPRKSVSAASESALIRLHMVGSIPSPEISLGEELPGATNYFIGRDPAAWRTNIKSYDRIRYANVYPGVDLVYHGNQQELEYDFDIAPGADPNRIEMSFDGAERLEINGDGQLLIHMSTGDVILRRPMAYQEVTGDRREVPVRYVLTEQRTVRFAAGDYDVHQPLVLDPVLAYSTYLGGSDLGEVEVDAIAVDSSGSTYVTGYTFSTDFPITNGFQSSLRGRGEDAFVTKLNPSGNQVVYSTYLGGNGMDYAYGVAVDSTGNAYIAGWTNSANFPVANAFQSSLAGNDDAFVTKLNSSGNQLIYSSYFGGSGPDYAYGIAVDSSGSVYFTGNTWSTDFPIANAFQSSLAGNDDAFVTKLNPSGNALAYSTYLGGSNRDSGVRIAVDSSGNVYFTGDTSSTNFPIANAFQRSLGGNEDAFVAKLNPAGSALEYSTYLGGYGNEGVGGIAVDPSGSAYISGATTSVDFPVVNAFQSLPNVLNLLNGIYTAFVTKLNPSGNTLMYSTYLGGSGGDGARGIAVDSDGNAYVAGWTNSPDFPLVNALQSAFGGGGDAFVTKLNASGNALLYSTSLGGSKNDVGTGIALDSSGNAYVGGYTASSNFPTKSAFQSSSQACRLHQQDAFTTPVISTCHGFVAKILGNPPSAPTLSSISPNSGIAGTTVRVTLTGTVFGPGITVNAEGGITVSNVALSGSTSVTATFTIPASASGTVSVSVTNAAGTGNAVPFTIEPPSALRVVSLTFSPSSVTAGQPSQGTLTMSRPAPIGGSNVSLSSNNMSVTVPATVTIPAGSTSASFTAISIPVNAAVAATITVSTGSSSTSGVLTVTPASTLFSGSSFNVPNLGAVLFSTPGTSETAKVGYAAIQTDPGSLTPSGLAIFGLHKTGVPGVGDTGLLITEAGVPATPLIRTGRLYAEVNGPVDTGVAVANPGGEDAVVNFSFTDMAGRTFGSGSTTIPAGQHIAAFLDQSPFNGGASIQGAFTFSSSVPVAVITLLTFTNERGDFLITTLPVADLSAEVTSSSVLLPHFADGAGWTTSVILLNPTDSSISGAVQFRDPSGSPQTLIAGGQTNNVFPYAIPGRSSFKLLTAGASATPSSGSVSVTPVPNTAAPIALAAFSYQPSGVTISQAGVPPVSGSALRMYVEASGTFGAAGSMQTAAAIANLSTTAANVNLEIQNLDGSAAAAATSLTLPGSGQVAKLLSDLFPNLEQPFRGVLRISTGSTGVAAVGLRTRYNDRGDFLITTTPPISEGAAPSSASLFFPQIVDGGGYATEFVLLPSAFRSSGSLRLFGQLGGTTLDGPNGGTAGGASFAGATSGSSAPVSDVISIPGLAPAVWTPDQ